MVKTYLFLVVAFSFACEPEYVIIPNDTFRMVVSAYKKDDCTSPKNFPDEVHVDALKTPEQATRAITGVKKQCEKAGHECSMTVLNETKNVWVNREFSDCAFAARP